MPRLLPALLLPLLLLAADDRKPEAGFVPLFDGKTLDGWVPVNAAPGTFSVKDGVLVTTGVPTGLLRTANRYENFVFEAEWMHVKPKGNSGIFVWADPLPAVGSPFTRAIEVQVLDGHETENYTSHGDVFAIWGAKFVPDREHPGKWMRCLPSEKRAKPAGQWNHYRIECMDGAIKLAVNGKVVSGGTKSTPRFGYICLEAEGSECRYRNLKIKELPSTKPTEAETCPEAQGHTTLFTGVDLKGWKADGVDKVWTVDPGANVLKTSGKGGALRGKPLWAERAPARYELVLDCKAPKGTTVKLLLGSQMHVLKGAGDGTGWARHVITVGEKGARLTRDGKPHLALLAESTMAWYGKPAGPFGLVADGPAAFCNLFLREVK